MKCFTTWRTFYKREIFNEYESFEVSCEQRACYLEISAAAIHALCDTDANRRAYIKHIAYHDVPPKIKT